MPVDMVWYHHQMDFDALFEADDLDENGDVRPEIENLLLQKDPEFEEFIARFIVMSLHDTMSFDDLPEDFPELRAIIRRDGGRVFQRTKMDMRILAGELIYYIRRRQVELKGV